MNEAATYCWVGAEIEKWTTQNRERDASFNEAVVSVQKRFDNSDIKGSGEKIQSPHICCFLILRSGQRYSLMKSRGFDKNRDARHSHSLPLLPNRPDLTRPHFAPMHLVQIPASNQTDALTCDERRCCSILEARDPPLRRRKIGSNEVE